MIIVLGDLLEPIENLDTIPSPYLGGMCDKFFNMDLIPLIQTTRGCPFQCTYCQEGHKYFNKVRKFSTNRIKSEIEYIAQRTAVPNFLCGDSNFGMYKEDIETCQVIANMQKQHDWPKYLLGICGKNNKDRVTKAASMVKGSYLSAAVQSTDEIVLKNIKRDNVSQEQMIDIAKHSEKLGMNSFSEVILGLPGDSKEKHFKSISDLIDAGINVVRSHQFILLSGSEAAMEHYRKQYDIKTQYRVIPKTVDNYSLWGEEIFAPEIDEICISNSTLSFEDYIECRTFDLTVEIFYNNGILSELIKILEANGISISFFIKNIYDKLIAGETSLTFLYNNFVMETKVLYESMAELENELQKPEIKQKYQSEEIGNNEQLVYQSIAIFRYMDEIHNIAFDIAAELFDQKNDLDNKHILYFKDLKRYSLLRKKNILSVDEKVCEKFCYDFVSLNNCNFNSDPISFFQPKGVDILFSHNNDQKDSLLKYIKIYGKTDYGLGNILSIASNVSSLYRNVEYNK